MDPSSPSGFQSINFILFNAHVVNKLARNASDQFLFVSIDLVLVYLRVLICFSLFLVRYSRRTL